MLDASHANCLQELSENRVHIRYAAGHTSSVITFSAYLSDIARQKLEKAFRLLNEVQQEIDTSIVRTLQCGEE